MEACAGVTEACPMRSVAALFLVVLSAATAWAQPAPLFLHLEAEKAAGVVEVNGAPALRFPPPELIPGLAGPDSTAFPLLPWLDDGPNRIVVRVLKLEPGGRVAAGVAPGPMAPPPDGKQATAPGELVLEAVGQGLPKWRWREAEPWAGDEAGLRAAVVALHARLAKGDVAALAEARKPMDEDFDALYGPEPAEDKQRFEASLKAAKLQPLPKTLKLAPIGDGRRVAVSDETGEAPIRYVAASKDSGFRVDAGAIWAKLGGQWKIVR
jgi:hypothetical protein